jgi:PAS domain S-box-containing protein
MQVSYGLWRAVRVFLVLCTLCTVQLGVWFGFTLLAPTYAALVLLVTTPLLLLAFLRLLGTSDTAEATWHESQLNSSRELYATIYNQSPVPYVTLDRKGRITTCNQSAARLLQTEVEMLVDTTLIDLFGHEDPVHLSVILGKLEAGVAIVDSELELTTYMQEKRYISLSVFTSQAFDQRLVAMVDMTHHKLVDTAKSEFVALATHQLRTPIAAIRWNVELLERTFKGTPEEKQANYLEKINRNVSRMLALINDFLNVSKLETGTFSTEPAPLSVREYLGTIVDEYQQAITEKQINLEQSYTPEILSITTDARLFHIITSNLLSNAVKYVKEGATIRFGYRVEGNEMVFVVADTGIGIPAEQLPQLFTKFFRASNAMTHRAEGTGLGLYIVRESVLKLGGTIDVQSIENQGTTFTIKLPL